MNDAPRLNGHQITNPAIWRIPIGECGKCARCQRKRRWKKIGSIALWTWLTVGGLSGLGMAWRQAAQPPEPKTAEQIAKEAKVERLQTALDAAIEDAYPEEEEPVQYTSQYDQ